jgi:uncharacterized membrane protein
MKIAPLAISRNGKIVIDSKEERYLNNPNTLSLKIFTFSMKALLVSIIASTVSFLAIDAVWLSTMAKRFYAPNIGHLLAESPKFGPAIAFYALYIFGVVFFVVSPALGNGAGLFKIFLSGAILGVVAYGTYDLTNQATLKDWPLLVTVVDLFWGALLTGFVSVVAVLCVRVFSE